MPLAAHHLVISGFRQDRRRLAGCDRVVAMLDAFRQPGVRVDYRTWNADWQAEANFIARHAPEATHAAPPRVCLYAYSWGLGWGASQLAWRLHELKIPVFGLIGCDGVYRHNYPLGNWRAFVPWSTIRLPGTVQRCVAFHQQNSWPAGHAIVIGNQPIKRRLVERVTLNGGKNFFSERATHVNIDESRQWIAACQDLAHATQRQLEFDERF